MRLYRQFGAVLPALDTPRGLVVTLADSDFREAAVDPAVYEKLTRIAGIINGQPGLAVEVDGYASNSEERAYAVRDLLVRDGVPANKITARSWGDSRPLASNATASGRAQNRRVEITISGSAIGDLPYWSKRYSLVPPQ